MVAARNPTGAVTPPAETPAEVPISYCRVGAHAMHRARSSGGHDTVGRIGSAVSVACRSEMHTDVHLFVQVSRNYMLFMKVKS